MIHVKAHGRFDLRNISSLEDSNVPNNLNSLEVSSILYLRVSASFLIQARSPEGI